VSAEGSTVCVLIPFIALLAWPLAATAQQRERMRRIGVLTIYPAGDPLTLRRISVFLQHLQQLGWMVDRLSRPYKWDASDAESARRAAAELVALAPDLILVSSGVNTGILLQATRTAPIVFRGRRRSGRCRPHRKPCTSRPYPARREARRPVPVQAPTKYETVLNMKTVKALGIQVPDIVLLRADEVIE
jgi:ABC-type uncharacterized transport system substrate-binding protein